MLDGVRSEAAAAVWSGKRWPNVPIADTISARAHMRSQPFLSMCLVAHEGGLKKETIFALCFAVIWRWGLGGEVVGCVGGKWDRGLAVAA